MLRRAVLSPVIGLLAPLAAHPLTFNSGVTYGWSAPAGAPASISNWTGAAYDAANLGGSGVNADGGADNGPANDASTYVANNQPLQGQSFTTGSNPDGYDLTAITARMAGYTGNNATGSNRVSWDLNAFNGPVIVEIGKITGSTTFATVSKQNFIMGDEGTPGAGTSTNGAGTYLTFRLPYAVHLEPNTTYGFDLSVGSNCYNFFEWLGLSTDFAADPYVDGAAYNRSATTITPLNGDRVFQLDLTARAAPAPAFGHPGTLHSQADLDLMKAKVLANEEPWLSGYNMLLSSPYNNLGWPAYDVDYINRGGGGANTYTRSQQDAQLLYTLAMIWHMTGDTAYADRAVQIANVWSDLIGITGDSNASLAAGICGYLFAIGGDLLSTYPGWPEAEKQAYKDMMMRVFYPANFDFLWRHHDTPFTKGGNTHYRSNWDTANMASMAAIGILCDNRAVYEQAVDYFRNGAGTGRVDRLAWYLFPEGLAQTEESGRDQGHNLGSLHCAALLCQMAWNQGDDLFGYDNNRVLRAFEYNAKYNLFNDVPWVYHRNCDLGYTETLSAAGRGLGGYYQWELVCNHYANVKGIAAPWSQLAADATRPEPWPNTGIHPSQVDWFGLGTLTYSKEPITTDQAPTGLVANWSKNRVMLNWWGSARATDYLVQRATNLAGPYTQAGSVHGPDLHFTDPGVSNGTVYYYKITAVTPSGNLDSTPLRVARELVTQLAFEGNYDDSIGSRDGTPHGSNLPGFASGFGGGQALSLNGTNQYLQLPTGSGNYEDITLAAWVRWNGGGTWQRVFDFGSEIEKFMMLTVNAGSNLLRFQMTTSRVADGTVTLTGPAMPTNTWTHVAITLNGDTATMYVNGLPVGSATADRVDPLFGQPFCYLGKSMWNADPYFSGRIDDFRIYNYGLSGDEVYDLWGQSANSPPTFDTDPIVPPNAVEDANYSAAGESLASHASDPDGGGLAYEKVSGPAWLTVATDGDLSGTPTNDDLGDNLFVVRVTDPSGATDDANLWITVSNTNDPPQWSVASLDGGFVAANTGYSFSVAGQATDIDPGDTLTYSKAGGPAWLVVAADGTLSGTPTGADAGTNTFTLRVSDALGAFDDTDFSVEVLPPDPTVAYWTFEEGAADSYVPYSQGGAGQYDGAITDWSGNGNPLSAWSTTWHWYRAETPAASTPQSGAANTLGVQNANSFPALSAIGTSLTTWSPTQWTIEAAIRPDDATNGYQTFVGRDSQGAYAGDPGLSALYFQILPDASLRIKFTDAAGNNWEVISAANAVQDAKWHAVAATSDGNTLSLYLKNLTDGDPVHTLLGSTDISASANPAISTGSGDGADWDPGVFTVGRGLFNGGHTDRFFGHLDDIRLSEAALDSSQFLYSTPPPVPSGLTATPVSSTEIDLSWTAEPEADSYRVKRGTTSGGPYSTIATGLTSPAFNDTSLGEGVTYYYVVRAENGDGASADSDEAGASTPPPAPTGLLATMVSDSAVDLSWSAANGAASYTLMRGTVTGGPYSTVATGIPGTVFNDTSLSAFTTYFYVVAAENAGGEGARSAEASVTTESPPITDAEVAGSTLSFISPGLDTADLGMAIAASVVGHLYQIEFSSDMSPVSWSDVGAAQSGNGALLQFSVPVSTAGPTGFYRIRITR